MSHSEEYTDFLERLPKYPDQGCAYEALDETYQADLGLTEPERRDLSARIRATLPE